MTFRDLAEEILEVLRRGVDEPVSDHSFNDLATRVFRFQCRSNQAYRGFVARRGVNPEEVVAVGADPVSAHTGFQGRFPGLGGSGKGRAGFSNEWHDEGEGWKGRAPCVGSGTLS